jgi:hypothetical protein
VGVALGTVILNMVQPRISFYLLPQDHASVKERTAGSGDATPIAKIVQNSPALIWTWLTYTRVKQAGVECELTDTFPRQGIVVSAACSVPLMLRTPPQVCHVCAVADAPPRFYPQIQVLQNVEQLRQYSSSFAIPSLQHIPHWAQPDLVPREQGRGETFVNIGFVGAKNQMAPELISAAANERFAELGLRWMAVHKDFNDYSKIDCLVGIRSFDGRSYDFKPASKLVNAWLAGVPAVLGPESAFRAAGKPGEDYLEAASLDDLFTALRTLKQKPTLRAKLVSSGREKMKSYSDEAITKKWVDLLTIHAPAVHTRWCRRGLVYKAAYHSDQYARRMGRALRKRMIPE